MENAPSTRAGTSLSSHKSSNKKQFVQYEPHLVKDFDDKKTKKHSVSGRLLTLIYKRLTFWSRYAKHIYKGRRYFWKSIVELSSELAYSEKQVARGLKALEELGMIKREQLNKHNWKRQYFYYLPKSVHTAEAEAPELKVSRSSNNSRNTTSSTSTKGSDTSYGAETRPRPAAPVRASEQSEGAPEGTGGVPAVVAAPTDHRSRKPTLQLVGGSDRTTRELRSGHFGSVNNKRNIPLLNKHLQSVVEKCLDYGINPPNPFTERGVGFAA